MKNELHTLLDIEATKQKGFDIFVYWTLGAILAEINRDHSDDWTDYNDQDWQEGWGEWCEGYYYKLIN